MVSSRVVALAQIILSGVFLIGYFWTLNQFLVGDIKAPAEWQDTIKALLSVLTAGVLMIVSYWFQRQRPGDSPSP